MTDHASVAGGTKIWKRVDGQATSYKTQVPGSAYLEQFPGATDIEKAYSNAKQPGGTWIADGIIDDADDELFEVERVHHPSVIKQALIVESTSKPPFGEWIELDEWPSTDA